MSGGVFGFASEVLRAEGRGQPRGEGIEWRPMIALAAAGAAVYGAVLGSYDGHPLQMGFSAVKVPLLLAVATLACLPSVVAASSGVGGSRQLAAVVRGLLASQATLGTTLAALAPIVALIYASGPSYRFALVFNGVICLVATAAGHVVLNRHVAPLLATNPRHRITLRIWSIAYALVAIQSAWVLRPFIGSPTLEPAFLRHDAWSNAYVEVAEDVYVLLLK